VSRIAPEVWTRLVGGRVQAEALWARRAAPEITDRLLAALDVDGERHLLVRLQSEEKELHDAQSRGVGVVTRELAMPGHETGQYLDIVCHDAAGHEAFDLIGGELAERLAAGRETATECVARVLAKWRRFWGQLPNQLLSRGEQLGLFAELWFLSVWLIPRVDVAQAVGRWRGPFGARHDFEWPGRSVEVKATTSIRGAIHRINGIEQLAPPQEGELLLFSLQLREESGANNTLPALVSACRQQFARDDEAWSRYETALVQAGYMAVHEEEYARMRLRIVAEGLYIVREDFPRLIPSFFPDGIPAGVERVEYEINLGGFERHCVAESPTDPFTL
jgi:hypothetical protein